MNIASVATLSSEPKMTDCSVRAAGFAAEPAVKRMLLVGPEVRPAEFHDLAGAEVGGERLDDAATVERELERGAERGHLPAVA